jgi:uncharacterized repeat protein (TIGR01451 family)
MGVKKLKARINYRSKKTIIIISIAVVLLIAAIAGTVAFVKGNKDAAAAMPDDNHGTSQNDGTNAVLPNNGDQNDGSDQNNDGTTLPTDGDNTNPADSNNNDNNGSTTNDGTTGTNGANGSTTGTTNGANTGANAGTTTGTTTAGNNGANVPNQDYAQTTTVITENPWEKKEIGWSPISVAAYTAASKLKVHKPDLDLKKYAYLDGDSLEELPVNTAAQKGETITYVIKITNKGNEDTNGIRTIDSIPEGTELASISEGGALNNDGKIVWKNDIKAGETVTVSFKVVVTADSIDLINNIAKVNGKETPETKTPVITANKTAQVVTIVDKEEVLENRDAKVGETIRYTITAKNTTEVDGTTVIKDSIPDGTSFVDGTITEKGNFDKENGTITWNNVVVPAKGEVSVSFDVVVNEKTTAGEVVKSVSNTATIGNTPTEEVETKVANITGEKEVSDKVANVGDTLTYTIILTNNGNGDGKVTVTDRVPEGTTIKDPEINGYDSKTNIMTWKDVEVKAGKSVELTFEVIVNDNTSIIKNKAYVDENKIPEEPETSVKHHYKVEHYTENLDGTYSKVEKDTVVSEDVEIGTKVSYKINNYDGFTFDESKTENKDATVPDNNNLIVKLYYARRNDLSYTVYYKEQGTENELADAKVVDGQTFGNVVTENAIDIDGYNKVDPTSANITITTGTNEHTFYYTKRNDLSYTVYYKEQGTENELADAKVVNGQKFGDVVTENAIDIDGYNKVNPTSAEITITTGTNEHTFYYTKRNDLSYTVNYLEKDTNTVLHEAKTVGNQTFGTIITSSDEVITIDGYNYDSVDKITLTIGTSENVINIYYTKRTDLSYTVNYLEKDTNTVLHEAKTVENQIFGTIITSSDEVITIDGYNYDSVDKTTLTIGTSENVINIYYTKRTDLSYTVNYYYNGELKHSVTFDNMEYLDKISGVKEMPKYNGVTYTKYDLKTSSANGLLPLIIGTGSNYINVYYGTPNVTISKKVNKTAVKVGDTLHYTIKVTETRGFVDASGVNVTDPISEGLENVRNITHNGNLNEGNVEWNNLAITKNSSITLEFDATVRANTIGKTISNTANLGGTTSGDSNTVTTTVSELKAAVKEVKKGTTGKDAVNIVLVMDLSYSMKSNKTSDEVTRLEAAKTAATKFINSIYTKDPESKVTVTVLTFNTANPLTTIKYVGTERCTNNNIWHLHLNCKNIDGVWYSKWEENTVEIPYSGTSKLGFADKSNYTSLVEEINEITLPNENPGPGLGTNVSAALDLTKTTIGDLKDNHSENSNVVILLSDGAPSKGHDGYEGNDNKTLINKASKIKGNPITTEFYSIQFGTEDGAYDLLKAMSSNNTVYTSNSINSLVENFTNILDQNTTKDPIDTVNGKYTTTLSNPLVVDADNPITVTYEGTTLFTCTSLPNNGLTYDSTTKTISWDINEWNAVEGHTKVTTNDIVIQCYVER